MTWEYTACTISTQQDLRVQSMHIAQRVHSMIWECTACTESTQHAQRVHSMHRVRVHSMHGDYTHYTAYTASTQHVLRVHITYKEYTCIIHRVHHHARRVHIMHNEYTSCTKSTQHAQRVHSMQGKTVHSLYGEYCVEHVLKNKQMSYSNYRMHFPESPTTFSTIQANISTRGDGASPVPWCSASKDHIKTVLTER